MNSAMVRFYGSLKVPMREDEVVDGEEGKLELTRAEIDALQARQALHRSIVGLIIFLIGIIVLVVGSRLQVDKIPVLGSIVGWIGVLATFFGLVFSPSTLVNRFALRNAGDASAESKASDEHSV
jgi:hypothetical protein